MSSADLSSANLSDANLYSADLSSANLSDANLSSADLSSANLIDANLSSADLSSANLSDANLSSSDLSSANLIDANLTLANLSGCDLSNADLTGSELSENIYNLNTRCPEINQTIEEGCGIWPPVCEVHNECPSEWIMIEGGTFSMGSDDSRYSDQQPIHTVTVPSFEMMKSEITIGMYRACVDRGTCSALDTSRERCHWSESVGSKEDYPANCMTWFQLNEFAFWVRARLPTEAEWEYAARSQGQNITYPWGEASPDCRLLNYNSCETLANENGYLDAITSQICSYPDGKTAQGLCDMAGNVSEWVQDEYHSSYTNAPVNGDGWCTGICPENAADLVYDTDNFPPRVINFPARVIRGGHLNSDGHRVVNTYRASWAGNPHFAGGRLARSVR